ncbi:hypothetical protein NDU88_001347 [Pleurodeles waltl]|uniref:Uncharacterized protein n=1 Tax=Pleurodeles waltl TaxID=8319 RepID=A0AAV7SAP4_PLEWA|nr:hypothetical protein NDU88_001347 [Pleurodeles waltl]
MWEGGGSRRSASAVPREEENAKEQYGDEEERDGGITDREEDEEVTAGQRNAEIGVWLLPNRGEAADGGLNTVATLGGRAQNPATLLEKRGIARSAIVGFWMLQRVYRKNNQKTRRSAIVGFWMLQSVYRKNKQKTRSPCEQNGHGGSLTSVAHATRPGCGQSPLSCRFPGAVCGAIDSFLASGRLRRSDSVAPRCRARSRANILGVAIPLLCVYGRLQLLGRRGSRHLGFANGAESRKDAPDIAREA